MIQALHRDLLRVVGARRGRSGATNTGRRGHGGAGSGGLEGLESRVLMSALTYAEFAQRFNIPDTIHDLQSPGAEYAGFGQAAAALGDINGDGFGDFAVSAPGSAFGAETTVAGAVFVFSGRDGALLRTLADGSAGFGFSLANVGDINNDGINDLLVGSPQFDTADNGTAERFGRAWVFSGADGAELRFHDGVGASDEAGFAVAALGDINNDGVGDYAVGSPGAGGAGEGAVVAYSGADGAVVYTFTGEAAGQRFGAAVIGTGDLGVLAGELGDGVGEIFIGAPGSEATPDFAGKVYLYDGATGVLRWALAGESAGDRFGTALGVAFPHADDARLYVGAPGTEFSVDGNTATDVGSVYLLAQDGVIDNQIAGGIANGRRGESIRMVGDIDGDGIDDLALITPGAEFARASIVSGANGQAITSSFEISQYFHESVFGLGDVNNDGFADIGGAFGAGDRFTVVSSLAVAPPTVFELASDNLAYMFTNTASGRQFAVVNGELMSFDRVEGLLRTDSVLGVNNSGDMVVRAADNAIYLIRSRVRTLLQDSFNGIPTDPAPIFTTFQFVRIGNGGDILFNDSDSSGDEGTVSRAWLLRGQALSFLWEGSARDVTAAGTVLGVRAAEGGDEVVVRNAEGAVTVLDLADAWRVNDNGLVVGVNEAGDLVTWNSGEVTVIGDADLAGEADTYRWIVLGVSNDGRVLVTLERVFDRPGPPPEPPSISLADYLYDPTDGIQAFTDITFDVDAGESPQFDRAIMLASDGTVLARAGAFTPVSNDAPWVGLDGTHLWSAARGEQMVIGGVNQFGDAVVLHREGDVWRGTRIAIVGLFSMPSFVVSDVLTHVNPDGTTHILVVADQGSFMAFRPGEPPTVLAATRIDAGGARIVDHSTVFASADGRVHLAGTTADGELVIYFQLDAANPALFVYDNLTQTHIESQMGEFHAVASNLTVLVADWGASHLFYLDDAGALVSVWIAPGMTYWASTNISEDLLEGSIADNPELALSGHITAYGTPWGGLNVIGEGMDTNPTAIWWVPGFGGTWRHDRIYGNEGQTPIAFNSDSTASYTTPWGGLNVATIQETGDIAVYWWVPGFDEWRGEVLSIRERPDGLTFAGDITASVVGDSLNLFARGNDGDLYRMFWNPGDEGMWNIENVTENVA